MKVAILVAMDKELSLLLSAIPDVREFKVGDTEYFSGKIGNHDVVVGKCGIGKVNSALNTFRLISQENPDLVINSGVAGGASEKMNIGDVVVADRVAYHDVWCGPGTEYGAADGFNRFLLPDSGIVKKSKDLSVEVHDGLICSGDKFIHTAEEIAEITEKFPDVLAVDMESASIGQTCTMKGIPFLIVRVLSDRPGSGDNISEYQDFWSKAPEKTFECVRELLESL